MRILFATKMIEDRNFFPAGIMYLSSYLKARGHETALADALNAAAVEKWIRRFAPDVIACSAVSGRYDFFRELSRDIKQRRPRIISLFGGPAATARPEILEETAADAVCVGEGEEALADLLARIENNNDYWNTPNWWVRRNGNIHRNDVRPLVADLDTLPFPDHRILEPYPTSRDNPVKIVFTSRGCPYQCSYCHNARAHELYAGKGTLYRVRRPDGIIAEIAEIRARYPTRFIAFYDEVFGMDARWAAEFSELYRREVALPFGCLMRPDRITEEIVAPLRVAGLHSAGIGIEAGSDDVRFRALNRRVSNQQLIEAARILKKHGVKVMAGNILGLPGSTLETEMETIALNRRCGVHFGDATIYQPYPATPLVRVLIERKLMDSAAAKPTMTVDVSMKKPFLLDLPHKRAIRNLHCLFPMAVDSAVVFRLLPFLVRLPLRPLYVFASKICVALKKRQFYGGVRMKPRLLLKILYHYLRY